VKKSDVITKFAKSICPF